MTVHDYNCTYCKHRHVIPGDKKKGRYEIEICKVDTHIIPNPMTSTPRYCQHFQMEGCSCDACNTPVAHP